jgi:ABC-type uncharacterized transport system permease subunit
MTPSRKSKAMFHISAVVACAVGTVLGYMIFILSLRGGHNALISGVMLSYIFIWPAMYANNFLSVIEPEYVWLWTAAIQLPYYYLLTWLVWLAIDKLNATKRSRKVES